MISLVTENFLLGLLYFLSLIIFFAIIYSFADIQLRPRNIALKNSASPIIDDGSAASAMLWAARDSSSSVSSDGA